ncbi:MAG: choice-of-anchor Q domain-containing protein [Candidatus Electrothrix communis]|nr:MAG: choice-of-anchor Q domain-containing protein [Candidatus Electrothrix communis]
MKKQLKYFFMLLGLLVLVPGWTQAAEIAVDADGMCTLAGAITAANTDTATGGCPAGSGNDTITLETDVILDAELPQIASPITIEGQEHSIDGNDDPIVGNILRVDTNGSLILNNSTIIRGRSSACGGGIYNEGTLILTNSTVSNNVASYDDGTSVVAGGGVCNRGHLELTGSIIKNNSVSCTGSALSAAGGGLHSTGSLEIDHSIINDNAVACNNGEFVYGGGIANITNSALATITRSTISDNHLSCNNCMVNEDIGGILFGGGIVNSGSMLVLDQITVSDNLVQGDDFYSMPSGGGVMNIGNGSTSITLTNSTISGNSVLCNSCFLADSMSFGGGIASWASTDATTAVEIFLINSTITGNSTVGPGGGIGLQDATAHLIGSIVSGNTASGSNEIKGFVTADSSNIFGHSGESNAQAFGGFTPGSNDLTATSDGTQSTALTAILSPLADNGGPTKTHALVPGSPAIDLDVNCSAGLVTDQRGEPRPIGDGCDAGSYEASVSPRPSNRTTFLSAIYLLLLQD